MAKAKYVNPSRVGGDTNMDMNMQQVDITDEIIDPDLFLRSFGISDDYTESKGEVGEAVLEMAAAPQSGVIIRNSQIGEQFYCGASPAAMDVGAGAGEGGPAPHSAQQQQFDLQNSFNLGLAGPVTLQQRGQQDCVSIPLATLQSILAGQAVCSQDPLAGSAAHRKRSHPEQGGASGPVFSVPSPVALSPVFIEQKPGLEAGGGLVTAGRSGSRPSPQSTPPPAPMDTVGGQEGGGRGWRARASGRLTPTGKRSRPHTPTSDCDSDSGSWREREPHQSWAATGRTTPTEIKPVLRLEELVDEDKYNKRKRSTSGGERETAGRKKDPMKAMLEQLQSHIPHIGNPDEEKVSHAGLLVEGSDYIRSLCRENNATQENVEALKQKIEQLNAEIEAFQEQLPEHGSSSIHRILSRRGKSIPDMFADHVRQRTQSDWRYWVYTSIMGHFVHTFAQEVSNISPAEMERTAVDWLQQRMSMQQLRKDAFRKLAKLCSKTSIMEDPSKLPEEARGFVALAEPESGSEKAGKL